MGNRVKFIIIIKTSNNLAGRMTSAAEGLSRSKEAMQAATGMTR